MKHLTPKRPAFIHANTDAVFVDDALRDRVLHVGHPVGAEHVAWQEPPDWIFSRSSPAREGAGCWRQTPVVLICRSGKALD